MKISKRKFADLEISIEFKSGTIRKGKNKDGEEWSYPMHCSYGYILGTHSPDGEHLDCYLRTNPDVEAKVYVVHQMTPDGSKFDEDKVMLGFSSAAEAKKMYLKHMSFSKHLFGGMCEFEMDHFKVMAYQASKSKCILAREDVANKMKADGVLPAKITTPIQLAKRISENQFYIRFKHNKQPLDYKPFTRLTEAENYLNRLPANTIYEIGATVSAKKERMLFEGFERGDLKGLLLPRISIDEYVAGNKANMVIAFFIQNEPLALNPLIKFLELTPGIKEVDTTDSDTLLRTSIVYLEFEKNLELVKIIDDLMYDMALLSNTKQEDFNIIFPNAEKPYPYSYDTVNKYITLAVKKAKNAPVEEPEEEMEDGLEITDE